MRVQTQEGRTQRGQACWDGREADGGGLVPSELPGLCLPLATWWSELTRCTVAVESGWTGVSMEKVGVEMRGGR